MGLAERKWNILMFSHWSGGVQSSSERMDAGRTNKEALQISLQNFVV